MGEIPILCEMCLKQEKLSKINGMWLCPKCRKIIQRINESFRGYRDFYE